MTVEIRLGGPADVAPARSLLPRLASFAIPEHREPEHLWQGDEALLVKTLEEAPESSFVAVAVSPEGLLGLALVSLRPELLSGEPSSHLEALVVAEGAQGQGLGGRLVARAEDEASRRGARSMTLHVFGMNGRARELYRRHGYDEEILRCHKLLPGNRALE